MVVDWSSSVNTKILRNGTSWSSPTAFISNTTRSGKPKRRMAHSLLKRPFSVKMRFTTTEYQIFESWFNTVTLKGLYPFNFKQIDEEGHTTDKVYQFTEDGSPSYTNVSGEMIECTMKWEEV